MSILSAASSRVYLNTVNPGVSEPNIEVGNFWINTAALAAFVNTDPTFGAQVWERIDIDSLGIHQINGDVGSITPTANVVTLNGGTTGLTTTGAASTMSLGGTLVVANGGSGATTLTGVLTGNGTSPFTASAIATNNVLVGAASNLITSVAPTVTTGVPLVSTGAATDPAFGTASVAGGGTGATTLTGVLTGNGTSPFTASAVTQYNALVGGASNLISSVAPTVTPGIPFVSTGAGSDPSFTTAVVAGGGSGRTTATAYALIAGGTTATNPHQSLTTGTTGQVLISQGAAALPAYRGTPSFMAFLNATATLAFTAGTPRTFSTAGLFAAPAAQITEDHDVGGDFDPATGLFTAPISGKYYFSMSWNLNNLAGGDDHFRPEIVTNIAGRVFQLNQNLGDTRIGGVNENSITMSCMVSLAAGNTVFARGTMVVAGGSALAVGSPTTQLTYFQGHLITSE